MSVSLFKRLGKTWFHASVRIEKSTADDYCGLAIIQSQSNRRRHLLSWDRHVLWIKDDQVLLDVMVVVLTKLMRGGYWRTDGPRRLKPFVKSPLERRALHRARCQVHAEQLPLFWSDVDLNAMRVM